MIPPPLDGNVLAGLEAHLARRSHVAALLPEADGRATITLAERARNRIVIQPQVWDASLLLPPRKKEPDTSQPTVVTEDQLELSWLSPHRLGMARRLSG